MAKLTGGKVTKGRKRKEERRNTKGTSLKSLYRIFYEIKIAEGRAETTLQQYDDNFESFLRYLKAKGISENIEVLDRDVMRGYIRYMREELVKFDGHKYKSATDKEVGLSISSVNTRLKTLRVLFATLLAEEVTEFNPMDGVKNLREEEEEITILSSDDVKRLISAPDKRLYSHFRDYVLMYFLFDSMIRISEALGLKKNDFDFPSKVVTIPASIAKNRKARTLALQDKTVSILRELIVENEEDFDSDYVFLSNYGEPLLADNFRTRLKKYAKQAGVTKNVHPHIFRHTAATLFLENGGDIRHLQMILGHSDIRMVQRYTHLSNRAIHHQQAKYSPVNSLDGKLNKSRKRKR